MTEQEPDALLRRALLDALALEWGGEAEPSAEALPVSAHHARQMRAMCRNPLKWSRTRGRTVWKQALRTAAIVTLACALTLAAVLAISPSARARVKQWFAEKREQDLLYTFTGEQQEAELPRYILGEVPEGYTLTGITKLPDESLGLDTPTSYLLYTYQNADGLPLYFSISSMFQGAATAVSTAHADTADVTVNDCAGWLFQSTNPAQYSSTLLWLDENANLEFNISGFLTREELFELAKSIVFDVP